MPQGQVVGRISVRVFPDTNQFRRDAQRQLDRIEKQLKIDVRVKPDMNGLLRELLTEVQKISQQNRNSNARKIRLYTTISTTNMTGELAKAIRRYNDKARTGEKVKLPTTLSTTDMDLEITQSSLDKMTDQLKDWRDRNSPLKIEIEPDVAASASALTSGRLAVLTRPRTVSIIPQINNAAMAKVVTAIAALSGMRVVNNLFEKFGNILKNLDKNVPIIGTLASAIAGLAAFALTSASNLFALSASLAQIGATALTLPGILGGFAVGIGITIAALKDFNKEIPGVKKGLSELQNQISSNFWAEAKGPIQDLINSVFPVFRKEAAATSTVIGTFFGSFADALTKSFPTELITEMFGYLNGSIAEATKGTGVFASIIAQLGQVGASYLPDLAGWFVDISTKFDDWLKKKGQLGLRAEINDGITALKDLGGVLMETGGILAGLSRAATEAGGSTLGMLRDTLKGIHETVDSPGFQKGMVDVFKAAHDAMSNLAAGAGPQVKNLFIELGQLLTTVLPQAGTILGTAIGAIADALSQTAVTSGITAMFDGLLAAVQALAPAMQPLGGALGAIMQVVAAMLPVFGELIAAAITPLANAVMLLAPALIPLVEILGGALTGIFAALGPLIMTVVNAVVPLVEQLVAGLAPVLTIIVDGFSAIVSAVMPVVDLLLQLLSAVITPLIPLIEYIAQAAIPPLVDAFKRVSEALQPFLQALIQVVNFLMPILVPAIQFLIDLIIGSLAMALDGIVLVITGVLDVIMGIWNVFAGIFTGDWSRAWDGVCQIFGGIWDIIVGIFEIVINVGILGFLKKGLALIKALWTGGWNAIKTFFIAIWEGMKGGLYVVWNALKGYIDDGLAKVSSLWRGGWNSVKTFFEDLWFKIQYTLGQAWSKLETAVSQGITNVIKFVKDLPKKAKDALSDIGSTLLNAGKELIKGFIKGLTSMFGGVQDALGNLTDKLTDWKGPESLDKVLLVNAGQLVIGGFIKGLESRYDQVRRSLRGLTQDVANTEFDSLGVGQIGVSRSVTAAVNASMAASTGGGTTKVLNYYAAPGSSLGSEEDLFAAGSRARMGW
ncbi:tape measure protein [Streptomyces phage Andris]|nr:tape measure protein [Streptomyces phage Andris]